MGNGKHKTERKPVDTVDENADVANAEEDVRVFSTVENAEISEQTGDAGSVEANENSHGVERRFEESQGDPASGRSEKESDVADERAVAVKNKKPLIKSLAMKTTINYMLFAVILLVLLWAVFFFAMFGFYGRTIEREADEVASEATSAFPKRYDDNSMMLFYKIRISEIARANKPVAIAVFTVSDSGKYDVNIVVDDMGNGSVDNNELFDSVMDELNFEYVFETGGFCKVSTRYGTYLCRGNVRFPETEDGKQQATYILVMKPYELFNGQTMKLLYMLIIGTVTVLVLAVVFSFFASRFQIKRLKDFSQKAKRVAEGDYNVRFSGGGYEEYDNLAGALNAATDNLQKSEKLQHDIIANVSHDIRTPLTMIRAYAEMLRDLPLDDKKRQKTASVIIAEADRLAGLTSDVLDYSRLSSGVTEFTFAPCNLSQVASAVIEQFGIMQERNGIKFVREIERTPAVLCDKSKIEQVFYNLIGNAVNYSGDDKTVIIRVKKCDDAVRVEIVDHGKGIESSELDAVWDRYYRSEHATRTAVGSGLGLSICKSVLTAHDYRFGVQSELGKGSTFWFEAPVAKSRGGGAKDEP